MYRVRIGPFDKKDDAERAKEKLSGAGVESALVRVQTLKPLHRALGRLDTSASACDHPVSQRSPRGLQIMKRREFTASLWRRRRRPSAGGPARAQGGPVEGTHYVRAEPAAVAIAPAGKVEVVEFFWYGCPHCNAFEPTLEAWVKKLPADVVFRRVPVAFRAEPYGAHQRIYFALETMGQVEAMHRKVFYAIHNDRAAAGQAGRHRGLHDQERRRRRQVPGGVQLVLACRPRRARPSSWPRPTRSTACRRWASRGASTPRAAWPARPSARWRSTDFLIAAARQQGRAERPGADRRAAQVRARCSTCRLRARRVRTCVG